MRLFWPNAQCHFLGLNKIFLHLMRALCFCIIMISYLVFFHLYYYYVITWFFSSNLEKKSTYNFFQRPLITRARRARAILLVFEKIYSSLFSPNCTRNHVITYTNHLTVRFNVLYSEKASAYLYVNWRADRIKPFLPIDVIAMIQSPGDVEI